MANGEVHGRATLAAAGSNGGDRVSGLHGVAGVFQQALIMAIKAEVAATVVEDDQQAGSAQPVGEYHASAVHRADGAAGARRNQYAVPFRPRIVAALAAEARHDAAIHRPRQLAAGRAERAAVDRASA